MTRFKDLSVSECSRCHKKEGDSFIYFVAGKKVCIHCLTAEDDYEGRPIPVEDRFDSLTKVVNKALEFIKNPHVSYVKVEYGKPDWEVLYTNLLVKVQAAERTLLEGIDKEMVVQ